MIHQKLTGGLTVLLREACFCFTSKDLSFSSVTQWESSEWRINERWRPTDVEYKKKVKDKKKILKKDVRVWVGRVKKTIKEPSQKRKTQYDVIKDTTRVSYLLLPPLVQLEYEHDSSVRKKPSQFLGNKTVIIVMYKKQKTENQLCVIMSQRCSAFLLDIIAEKKTNSLVSIIFSISFCNSDKFRRQGQIPIPCFSLATLHFSHFTTTTKCLDYRAFLFKSSKVKMSMLDTVKRASY